MVVYRVYVVELDRRVFSENRRFREANPQWNGVKACLYVGQTSKDPDLRLDQHKSGYRNAKGRKVYSNIVYKYGLHLRPDLYSGIGPLSRQESLSIEEGLALELRKKGYAVWWK